LNLAITKIVTTDARPARARLLHRAPQTRVGRVVIVPFYWCMQCILNA